MPTVKTSEKLLRMANECKRLAESFPAIASDSHVTAAKKMLECAGAMLRLAVQGEVKKEQSVEGERGAVGGSGFQGKAQDLGAVAECTDCHRQTHSEGMIGQGCHLMFQGGVCRGVYSRMEVAQ